jgi:hypothetical protein
VTPAERIVLLAAAASPLEWYSGEWYRVDLPAGRQLVRVGVLLQRGLLRRSGPVTLALTDATGCGRCATVRPR